MPRINDALDSLLPFFGISLPMVYQYGQQEHYLKILCREDPVGDWNKDWSNCFRHGPV